MLPEYKESLHVRYPPVCENCLPAVEEEIRSKDHMARTKALGGWLKQSKGKEKQRKISGSGKQREKLGAHLFAWKVRGCLWMLSLLIAIAGNSIGKCFAFLFAIIIIIKTILYSCLWLHSPSSINTPTPHPPSPRVIIFIMGSLGSNICLFS